MKNIILITFLFIGVLAQSQICTPLTEEKRIEYHFDQIRKAVNGKNFNEQNWYSTGINVSWDLDTYDFVVKNEWNDPIRKYLVIRYKRIDPFNVEYKLHLISQDGYHQIYYMEEFKQFNNRVIGERTLEEATRILNRRFLKWKYGERMKPIKYKTL